VTSGGGKTLACATCHGADLKNLGPVPGIVGRSPSYLVRQLYDMQAGTGKQQCALRHGSMLPSGAFSFQLSAVSFFERRGKSDRASRASRQSRPLSAER